MNFIRSLKIISSHQPNGKTIVYMMGYGGYLWQSKRQIALFKKSGYNIIAMDFVDVLKRKNPNDLLTLMDNVSEVLSEHKAIAADTILFGVSLGGLVGYNMIKRYSALNKLIVITGGDMTHIPAKIPIKRSLVKHWGLTREQLAESWKDVNIYSEIGKVKGKNIIMILPSRDKVINPQEVSDELNRHRLYNNINLISRSGGHFRTIISETIIKPNNGLALVKQLTNY